MSNKKCNEVWLHPHDFLITEGLVLDKRFLVGRTIGKGGFGIVFLGHDLKTRKEVAIKVEPEHSSSSRKLLGVPIKTEQTVLTEMHGDSGFCNIIGFGAYGRESYLVMDLLGPTLFQLFSLCSNQFSLKTLLLLTDQMLLRLEQLHYRGYIHRDLKPENFMMGTGPEMDTLYLIDFGLAQRFCEKGYPTTGEHVEPGMIHAKIGTPRYMSLAAHGRYQQSRKDDLEAMVYVLAYFATQGKLPWMNLEDEDERERAKKLREMKSSTKAYTLFEGLPLEFAWFAETVKELGFEERPKYLEYRKAFWQLASSLGYKYDGGYDWKVLKLVEVSPEEQKETEKAQLEKPKPSSSAPSISGESDAWNAILN